MTLNLLRQNFRGLVRKQPSLLKTGPRAEEQGLTLIECLVAIMMVAIVASAIAPALVISVATRVQSQKAEQALVLAQSEIDRVRLLVERREATPANLPPSLDAGATEKNISDVAGPVYGAPVAAPATAFQTRAVDLNGNRFAIQSFRTPGSAVQINGAPVTFNLGVRVYDEAAVTSGGVGNLSSEAASLGMVGVLGDRQSRPLAALYTNIAVSDQSDSLCDLITYIDAAALTPVGCD
jgi:prepilin-type N-terminal cleavage/methylation domain-containing protein